MASSRRYDMMGSDVGRYASIGSVSVGMGALAYFGTMAAVGAWGTASTGVAISALSGATASNASLAFLGGGALAAGGGGVALGSAVLTGGIGAVVVGAGAGVVYLWRLSDRRKEIKNLIHKVESMRDPTVLDLILVNDLQNPVNCK